ncbi:MAG: DUF4440 domain-containing protein [Gemmatimonadetes bacterium]|nr:DUF4440 domain-containing protein [Gemmatimonadota bacterium]NIR77765.1 DUF4440 domain-containing protein [Gemmatimonadota bacterium]NIT86301.1 DUF4440 domain-containing protein [Gemmatimonadota bacterium]NIU30135.1 DUF4440 domain-containing protein [Gemmatimonadota bacterium]NIU35075.1 DUF4440 domain-containing protein [Gemmatimonadota bacterium]
MCRHPVLALSTLLLSVVGSTPADAGAQPRTGPTTVEAFADAFASVVRARDVDAWTELVTEDVVMMPPGGRVVEGRRAFHDLWSRSFEGRSGPNPLRVTLRDARVLGEVAVVRADYGPEEAGPVGQYVWLLERDARDVWRLAWWIFTRRSAR